jgi:hypothetical protein
MVGRMRVLGILAEPARALGGRDLSDLTSIARGIPPGAEARDREEQDEDGTDPAKASIAGGAREFGHELPHAALPASRSM